MLAICGPVWAGNSISKKNYLQRSRGIQSSYWQILEGVGEKWWSDFLAHGFLDDVFCPKIRNNRGPPIFGGLSHIPLPAHTGPHTTSKRQYLRQSGGVSANIHFNLLANVCTMYMNIYSLPKTATVFGKMYMYMYKYIMYIIHV